MGVPSVAALFFLASTFLPSLRHVRHGFPTYYVAARLVLEGRFTPQVYDNDWFVRAVQARTPNGVGEVFAPNPPSAALLMLPLAWLDMTTARRVWLWLSLALLAATIALPLRHTEPARPWQRAAIIALPFVFAPLHENFRLANVYVPLLFLFTLALAGLERGATVGPGAALGLAAGLKLSGGPVWLLLAARGRWRALASAAVMALVLVGLSVLVTGLASWQRFAGSLLEHAAEPGWAAGLSFQATPSFFQHLFRPDARWNPQPLWVLPAWAARAGTFVVSGAAVGLLLWKCRRAGQLQETLYSPRPLDLAYAAAVTLGVVVLPFAEEYHYALLLLPLSVAVARLARGGWPRSHLAAAWLAIAFILLALPWPYKDPWLNLGWHALLGYPRLYGGWLLWGWLMRAMVPLPAEQPAAAPLASEPSVA
jgi:hypothetical protein